MPKSDDIDRVWSLIEDIGFCMLCTRDGEDIRSRPMAAHPVRDENAVYFLTDTDAHKDVEVQQHPNVGLAFAEANDQKYVSLTGRAELSNDRAKIRELWSTPAKAWWDSPDDPKIRVLKVKLRDAQYWASPGTLASYVKMLAAAMGDHRPAMGDRAKVELT